MATYYWVGGTGNWDATTTHWSTVSGGAGGSGPPTSADDVVFDSLSNATAYTVTLLTSPVCRSVSIAGPASGNVTVAGTATWLVYGSLTLAATGITRTYSGAITFAATTTGWTITTNGVALGGNLLFSGVGGGWTLGSALNTSGSITPTNGTFDTSASGNYSLTASNIALGAGTKTLNLNGSTVTLNAASPISFLTNGTGFTFNAGTSQINLSYTAPVISPNGVTFYNLTFSSNAIGTAFISGSATYNNLSFTAKGTATVSYVQFTAAQTINGTLSVPAPSASLIGIARYFFQSNTYGTAVTITGNTASLTDADFRDITHSGTTWTGTRLGDAGNNSGITFSTPKTVYWNLAGSNNWNSNGWATTSSGTPALANFPLAQDTATFTNTAPVAGSTVTLNVAYNLPAIDFSSRSNTLTFATGTVSPYVFGSITLSSAITLTGTGAIIWGHRSGTKTITTAGVAWTQPITIACIGATLALGDALSSSAAIASAGAQGGNNTFTTNGFNLTCTTFSNSVTTNTINLGASTITITGSGASAWTVAALVNAGTSTISLTSASAKTFVGNGKTYYNLNQGGAGALTISGSNTFNNITNSVQPTTVTFPAATTNTFANFSLNGTAGNLVTINSSTAGTRANLVKTGADVSCDYLNIKDLAAV